MTRLNSLVTAALGALAVSAMPASATTINFDNLGNGAVVTNQYAGVTFSSIAGSEILTSAQNFGTSAPNFICSGRGGSINCSDPVYLDFAQAISGLSFIAVGDDDRGINGQVAFYGAGGQLLGTQNIFGDANSATTFTITSLLSGIRRVQITTTDAAGLGYDDFTFNAAAGAVPEPVTWAMMLTGFGLVGGTLRRREKAALAA